MLRLKGMVARIERERIKSGENREIARRDLRGYQDLSIRDVLRTEVFYLERRRKKKGSR